MSVDVQELPKSSQKIYEIVKKKGPLTQKDVIEESDIPARTARYAIKRLIELGLIVKRSNLSDMRSVFYFANIST